MQANMHSGGQRVVITGAGSGLGRELALCYARAGARLALADLHPEGLKETLELVDQAGGNGFTQRCDVRDFSQLAALAQTCEERMDGIDVLINNAGVSSGGFFWDLSLEDWEWQISINLMGVVKGCRAQAVFTAGRCAGVQGGQGRQQQITADVSGKTGADTKKADDMTAVRQRPCEPCTAPGPGWEHQGHRSFSGFATLARFLAITPNKPDYAAQKSDHHPYCNHTGNHYFIDKHAFYSSAIHD